MPLNEQGGTGKVLYPDFGGERATPSSADQPHTEGRVLPSGNLFKSLHARNTAAQRRAAQELDAARTEQCVINYQLIARDQISHHIPQAYLGDNVISLSARATPQPLLNDVRSFFHMLGLKEDRMPQHLVRMEDGVEYVYFDQNLNIHEQEHLSTLPDGLFVTKSLRLPDCHNLKALPKRLFVGMDLDISGNMSLVHIPRDLHVVGNVLMHNTFLNFDIEQFKRLKLLCDEGSVGRVFYSPIPFEQMNDTTSQDDFWSLAVQSFYGAEYFIHRGKSLQRGAKNKVESPHAMLRDDETFEKLMREANATLQRSSLSK